MAFYQILYWQKIPSQIKAWDDFDEVKFQLDQRLIARIDALAQATGLTSDDDYLAQWNWSEVREREGEPEEVINLVKEELEAAFNKIEIRI